MRRKVLALAAACALLLCSCAGKAAVSTREQTTQPAAAASTATLYVGSGDSFREYRMIYTGELTPQKLLDSLAGLTGWDLATDGAPTTADGAITVSFAETSSVCGAGSAAARCALFEGDGARDTLVLMLDSVRKTLAAAFPDAQGSEPQIYFTAPQGGDIFRKDLRCFIDAATPYLGADSVVSYYLA